MALSSLALLTKIEPIGIVGTEKGSSPSSAIDVDSADADTAFVREGPLALVDEVSAIIGENSCQAK